MSQQLQITGGAKVRDLQDVIIGTSGVLSSLAFNVANGVPKLDVNGKILVSQLPNSVMEYKGTWDASTNTPTLVNGTGNQGDVYLCNVAGTVNFGAGPIAFFVGDQVIYSGAIWQRASGATGTVTSVGLTSTGNDAITITGSPITTSGNINLGFAGTNLQYINGAGDLTTFPTLLSSVGLSMPSAFSVANSPLTANGTIAVTGAGVASQYIRGDGTLANFPTSGGGGGSVSYYLNGSINQGTFVGNTYYEMSKVPVIGAGTDFTINANGYISQFITDANDPALLEIPAGNWNFEMFFSASSSGGTPSYYVELYKYNGTTFTLISSSSATPEVITGGTAIDLYTTALAVPTTALTLTDRLAVRVYVTHSGRVITLHTEDSHLCQVVTTFSTGITALNGLTAQVQYLATGTSGTDFAISSSVATHTFNLPVASAANTGKLSSTDWSTFNGKVPYTGATGAVDLGAFDLTVNGVKVGKGSGGTNNTRVGASSFISNTTGYDNTAIGNSALYTNTTGNINTALGSYALSNNISGTVNTAIGYAAGSYITTGSKNTIIGSYVGTATMSNNIVLADGDGNIRYQWDGTSNNFDGILKSSGALWVNTSAGSPNSMIILAQVAGTQPPTLGNSSIGVNTTDFRFTATTTSTNFKSFSFSTSSLTNNSVRTYSMPDASGTIALTSDLTGYVTLNTIQTITAEKIFSSTLKSDNYGILLRNNGGYASGAGYTTIGGISNGLKIVLDTASIHNLQFNTSASYNYTFPSATGTLALTSDLGSYLPLTGGTLTGGLYINPTNTATVGLDVASNTTRFRSDNLEGFKRQLEITMGSGTLVQMVAKGFGANYGTDLAFYSSTSGGVNSSPAIYITGTNNRVGIKTGTPAYDLDVSGTIRATGSIYGDVGFRTKSLNGYLLKNDADSGNLGGLVRRSYWAGGAALDTQIFAETGYGIYLNVNGSTTSGMTITSAGNVGIGTTTPLAIGFTSLEVKGTTAGLVAISSGAGSAFGRMYNAGSQIYFGTSTAHPVLFDTNDTERMRITSGGKVMVNTTDSGVNALLYASANQNEPYPLGSKATTSSQGLVGFFDNANSVQGSISISGSTVSYNSFMGSHYSQFKNNDKPEVYKGTILEAIDELCEWEGETNDRLAKIKISDTIESKNVYGIFLDWDNTDEFNDMFVAALGTSYIRVNKDEIVSMGDLLQSNGDGTAKVQSDDIMRSSTIAKVTSTQKITTYEDGSYLIAATLHCG